MSDWAPRKFWKEVAVQPREAGWTVELDGRLLRTPAKRELVVPTQSLAEAMAEDWRAQDERIDPETMPVTRSSNAALDKVAPQRAEVVAHIAEYGDTDLLCYRATTPEGLVARQDNAWNPMLDWCQGRFDARLTAVAGVIHAPQPGPALGRLRAAVEAYDVFALTGLHDLVALSGSLVLGLAAAEGARPPEELWALSRLDEDWQAEQWGHDDEAAAMAEKKRGAFLHAKRFVDLSRETGTA